ncbi:hypothetical protein [Streptomyces sp. NPDC060035]|uniref:hypothetical protein n=1 Tax=Streptomyces sp. NPDC060035 TaxID=3347044 RepID=UPI0036BEC4D6
MNHAENVDHDAVLRARVLLLGSGRINIDEEIDAYRVLARVSPAVYLPRLATKLLTYGYPELQDPAALLALGTEAAAAARGMDRAEPNRTILLTRALQACRHELYILGRRKEAFAVCEEMARAGREAFEAGHVASPLYAHGPLAAALAEEGRHSESARLYGEMVGASRAEGDPSDVSFWSMVAWAAELDASGQHGAAIDAFTELVSTGREKLDLGRTSLAIVTWELIRLAQMLDADGRRGEARATRKEALGLLTELAESGERQSWSNIVSWWLVLLTMSGRTDEEPVPGEPAPAFGLNERWSPDIRRAYLGGREALEADIAALTPAAQSDPRAHLAELVVMQRRLTIRSSMYWESRTHVFVDPLRPLFDEGLALTRRLADVDEEQGRAPLAGALTDRSTLLVAGKQYGQALTDFREAVDLLEK